ncbi:hypothetical protein [Dyadobacter crusticola]|uniref:hypothetical protein n=1 Tax=Dyadobacter crusticola TaxID=292407 RepID=UPI0004E17103|nr:hypothetical protein [Dyadobacter crusticola]
MRSFFCVILLAALASCDKSGPSYSVIPSGTGTPGGSGNPVVEIDSTRFDKPEFGDPATTVRQFPYGPGKAYSGDIRLVATKREGLRFEQFIYDKSGKLAEKKMYAGDGKHVYASSKYLYHTNAGIAKIEYWINVIGIMPEGYPTTDELYLYSSTKFENGYIEGTYHKVNQRAERQGNYHSPEPLELGFDKNGRLVWEGGTQDKTHYYSYTAIERADNGNIVKIKNRYYSDYKSGNQTVYTYDDKKNPYYTTGDPADWSNLNINNVIASKFTNNQKYSQTATFEYTYRPDGYPQYQVDPATKKVIMEFIYNK